MQQPNVRAWDGHSRRSSIALIVAFLLNGIIAWPASLCLGTSFVVGYSTPTAIATAFFLFFGGLMTMAYTSRRQKSSYSNALRWIAIGLNSVLLLTGGWNWVRSFAESGELFNGEAAIIAIGITNIVCISLIRHYYSGTLCPCCGYDLRHLRSTGCPECGWQRH
jgi:hypothetical protein